MIILRDEEGGRVIFGAGIANQIDLQSTFQSNLSRVGPHTSIQERSKR